MDFTPIEAETIDDLYKKLIKRVFDAGIPVTARGLSFTEARYQHLILTNPRARLVCNPVRKINKHFLAAEFIWMMSGQDNLELVVFYNKNYTKFSDDGLILHGAYGPRLRNWAGSLDQLTNCLERLKNDLYTRQAIIIIPDPSIDFTVKTKDIPCNNYLQFLYRDGKLDLMCYVRSNDMNLGFPYDAFHWCMLQEMFASILNVEVGDYHHIIGSMHIYEQDVENMKKILNTEGFTTTIMSSMPHMDDLSVIDRLATFEYQYRRFGTFDEAMPRLGYWWESFASWLKK